MSMDDEIIFDHTNNGVKVYAYCDNMLFGLTLGISWSRMGRIVFSRKYGGYTFRPRDGVTAISAETLKAICKKITELEKKHKTK